MPSSAACPGTPLVESVARAIQKSVAEVELRSRAGLAKTGKLQVGDPEDDAADQLDMLVACTLAWSGAAVPYSPAAARSLYGDKRRTWLRDQVQAALDERELFTRSSAAT